MKIIYILSLAHSGSTINDLILGAHPLIHSCGEIKHLKRYTSNTIINEGKKNKCTCGASPLVNCSFWKKVIQDLKGKNISFNELESESYKKTSRLLNDSYLFFESVSKVSGCNIILDSSKSHERLKILTKHSKLEIKTIFLFRDPFGQINSILKIKGYSFKNLIVGIKDYFVKYIRYLNVISQLNKNSYMIINYNFFARNYLKNTKNICKFINIDYKKNYFTKWQSVKHHNISGNNFRFNKRGSEVKVDNNWIKQLPFTFKVFIFLFSYPVYFLMKTILFFSKEK